LAQSSHIKELVKSETQTLCETRERLRTFTQNQEIAMKAELPLLVSKIQSRLDSPSATDSNQPLEDLPCQALSVPTFIYCTYRFLESHIALAIALREYASLEVNIKL